MEDVITKDRENYWPPPPSTPPSFLVTSPPPPYLYSSPPPSSFCASSSSPVFGLLVKGGFLGKSDICWGYCTFFFSFFGNWYWFLCFFMKQNSADLRKPTPPPPYFPCPGSFFIWRLLLKPHVSRRNFVISLGDSYFCLLVSFLVDFNISYGEEKEKLETYSRQTCRWLLSSPPPFSCCLLPVTSLVSPPLPPSACKTQSVFPLDSSNLPY